MADSGAIRAGRAFVELYADNSQLPEGLSRAEQRFAESGNKIRSQQEQTAKEVRAAQERIANGMQASLKQMAAAVAANTRAAAARSNEATLQAARVSENAGTALFGSFTANGETAFHKMAGGFGLFSVAQTAVKGIFSVGDDIKNALNAMTQAVASLSDSLAGLKSIGAASMGGLGTGAEQARAKLRSLSEAAPGADPEAQANAARAQLGSLMPKPRAKPRQFMITPRAERLRWEAWGFPKDMPALKVLQARFSATFRAGASEAKAAVIAGVSGTAAVMQGLYGRWQASRERAAAAAAKLRDETAIARRGTAALAEGFGTLRSFAWYGQIFAVLTGNRRLLQQARATINASIGATLAAKVKNNGLLAASIFAAKAGTMLALLRAINVGAYGLRLGFVAATGAAQMLISPLTSSLRLLGLLRGKTEALSRLKREASFAKEVATGGMSGAEGGLWRTLGGGAAGLGMALLRSKIGSMGEGLHRSARAEESTLALGVLTGDKAGAKGTMQNLKQLPITQSIDILEGKGVGVLAQLGQQMGKSEAEVRSLAATGQISFGDLQTAITSVARKTKGFDEVASGAGLLSNTLSRLSTSWTEAMGEMAQKSVEKLRLNELAAVALPLIQEIPSMVDAAVSQLTGIGDWLAQSFLSLFGNVQKNGTSAFDYVFEVVKTTMRNIPYFVRNATKLIQIAALDITIAFMQAVPGSEQAIQSIAASGAGMIGGFQATLPKFVSYFTDAFREILNIGEVLWAALRKGWESVTSGKSVTQSMKDAWDEGLKTLANQKPPQNDPLADFSKGYKEASDKMRASFEKKPLSDQLKQERDKLEAAVKANEQEVANLKAAQQQDLEKFAQGEKDKAGDKAKKLASRVRDTEDLGRFQLGTADAAKLILAGLGRAGVNYDERNNKLLASIDKNTKDRFEVGAT